MSPNDELRRHPFARGLSEPQVAALAPLTRVVSFPAGSTIFDEGSRAHALYLIVEGRVVLDQHIPGQGEMQLESLSAGDMLGLSWLFPEGKWALRARASEATVTLALEASTLLAQMEADPRLGLVLAKHIIEQLYERLERVRLQRLDVYRGAS